MVSDIRFLNTSSMFVITETNSSLATWADSFTKLLAFNQTQYDRVLSLDSDATLLQVCVSGNRSSRFSLLIQSSTWMSCF